MEYQYFDASKKNERDDITQVILKDRLLKSIKKINPWIDEENLVKVYNEVTSINGASLMEINQNIWQLLRNGPDNIKQ